MGHLSQPDEAHSTCALLISVSISSPLSTFYMLINILKLL